MGKVTRRYVILPWLKGLDTDTDAGVMQFIKNGEHRGGKADSLVQADNIVYALDASKNKRDGFTYHDSAAITNTPVIRGGFDYWANVSNTKTQRIVVWDNQATSKAWFQTGGGGAWTELTKDASATAPTALTRVCFEVFNDDLVMAITDTAAAGRAPLKWDNQTGTAYVPLGGSPPNVRFIRRHQGRLWGAGNPANPDRLYFTSPGNHEEWSGTGDSGAIDIDPGDGDSSGISAIFPSFRGDLFVAKQNALYRISGTSPVDYRVEQVTAGVGCISHNSAIAVDMDDVYFCSERGFHSLVLTQKYGDFEGAFLSKDIQTDFNALDAVLKPYIQGCWIPSLNSVMWNVSDNGTNMDEIWLYDVRYKAWYKWDGVNPTALFRVEDASTKIKRAYFGDSVGRLSKTQNTGIYHDYTSTAISQIIKTPFIYPSGDPASVVGLKKLGIWAKLADGSSLTAAVTTLGSVEDQTVTFTSSASFTARLDVDFILGESLLNAGATERMIAFAQPIDGYTRGLQITFTQATADQNCRLYGFWVEYEEAGDSQETMV